MTSDSDVREVIAAIHVGDVAKLQRLLADNPGLAASRLGGIAKGRTPLHVVADWPGYFPNGPRIVRLLIAAGADPNARDPDQPSSETPLHWAASSDDVDVARALIDCGADVETPNGSIGTPLDNAIGYACWHVARLLVQRGAIIRLISSGTRLPSVRSTVLKSFSPANPRPNPTPCPKPSGTLAPPASAVLRSCF